MSLTPTVEEQLWSRVGARRIADVRGFPSASHDALREAVTRREAQLGIAYHLRQ
jgi:hypothetical protein